MEPQDHKNRILECLATLKQKEEYNNDVWKARAYGKAIGNLKRLDHIYTIEDIDGVPGVGNKIRDKIQEIIATGDLRQVRDVLLNQPDTMANLESMKDLMRIHGIGTAKAKDLVENHKIKSVEELLNRQDLLNDPQKIGIKYYKDLEKRIPYSEMVKHDTYIKAVVQSIENAENEIVGSFRRGEKSSGDIDVLICSSNEHLLSKIIKRFSDDKYVSDTLAIGNKKFMGVCKMKRGRTYRRLDILVAPPAEYPFALLYFTGSADFNQKIRAWALSNKKVSLSEHGLKDLQTNTMINTDISDEKGIFEYLGIEYVSPSNRSNNVKLVDL